MLFAIVLQHDWRGVDVQTAETMAFVTLSLCELFRAYTVRSERVSIFTLGIFTNKFMQYAVGLSIFLLLLVVNVPFLQPIFNTHFLAGQRVADRAQPGYLPRHRRRVHQTVSACQRP